MNAEPQFEDFTIDPMSLKDVDRIELDIKHLDFRIEADPELSGAIQMDAGGAADARWSVDRNGRTLTIHQTGRNFGRSNRPRVVVPQNGCPPIAGKVERGDLVLADLVGDVDLSHSSGSLTVQNCVGTIELTTGSADARVSELTGALNLTAGRGDVLLTRVDAAIEITVGSGDVRLDSCSGPLVVRIGSGDLQTLDCAGALVAKLGSGDVLINRSHEMALEIENGRGDIFIREGRVRGMTISTKSGDIQSSAHLLLGNGAPPDVGSPTPSRSKEFGTMIEQRIMQALESKGFEFDASDQGLRFVRGPFSFHASDDGLRVRRGKWSFEAGPGGVRVVDDVDNAYHAEAVYSLTTNRGDISIDVPGGVPVRVETIMKSGDLHSDIPLVSVGRPGPRGATQRLVGAIDPNADARMSVRLETNSGDISIRTITAPSNADAQTRRIPVPPKPAAPPMPAAVRPAQAPNEEALRQILDRLASGELTVSEADAAIANLSQHS